MNIPPGTISWHRRSPLAAAVVAVAVASGGCSGDEEDDESGATGSATPNPTPTLTGDDHILSVAESIDAFDLPEDREIVIELGHRICEYLDETDGDFDSLDYMIGQSGGSDVSTVKLGVVAFAGVPAYCPEWTDGMIEWSENEWGE